MNWKYHALRLESHRIVLKSQKRKPKHNAHDFLRQESFPRIFATVQIQIQKTKTPHTVSLPLSISGFPDIAVIQGQKKECTNYLDLDLKLKSELELEVVAAFKSESEAETVSHKLIKLFWAGLEFESGFSLLSFSFHLTIVGPANLNPCRICQAHFCFCPSVVSTYTGKNLIKLNI